MAEKFHRTCANCGHNAAYVKCRATTPPETHILEVPMIDVMLRYGAPCGLSRNLWRQQTEPGE